MSKAFVAGAWAIMMSVQWFELISASTAADAAFCFFLLLLETSAFLLYAT